MRDSETDRFIAGVAREGAADGFESGFASRTVQRILEEESASHLVRQAAVRPPGVWPLAGHWVRPALALAGAVLLVLAVDWSMPHRLSSDGVAPAEYRLSDGSEVSLAPGSHLLVRRFRFHSSRRVQLEGEAFFVVAHEARPFQVSTPNAAVTVTGTRFNVRSRGGQTTVSVEEGGVLVQSRDGASGEGDRSLAPGRNADRLQLGPGQSALVTAQGVLSEDRYSVEEALSWREGGLTLVELPLVEILAELERRFAVRLESDPSVRQLPATYISREAPSVESVLDAVCFALNLRYRPIRDGYRIETAP